MIDWRELMPSVPASVDPRNHPQNPQNYDMEVGFEDFGDTFKAFHVGGEGKPAPFEVGDCITYRVPGDPEKGPFEVVDVSQDSRKGGWWAVVLKPSENEEGEPKPDTLALAPIHQILVTRVIPKESLTP